MLLQNISFCNSTVFVFAVFSRLLNLHKNRLILSAFNGCKQNTAREQQIGIEVGNLDAIRSSLRKTMRGIIKKHSPEKAKKWYYDLQLCRAGIIKEEDVEKID